MVWGRSQNPNSRWRGRCNSASPLRFIFLFHIRRRLLYKYIFVQCTETQHIFPIAIINDLSTSGWLDLSRPEYLINQSCWKEIMYDHKAWEWLPITPKTSTTPNCMIYRIFVTFCRHVHSLGIRKAEHRQARSTYRPTLINRR